MSGSSKVIVLDPDVRASRQVQLGFEREGIPVAIPAIPPDLAKLELHVDGELGIALVGGGIELVRRTRELLAAKHADVPIVYTGNGASRAELAAAGADEIVTRPAFLRDVVTIARILRDLPAAQRDHVAGSLAETTGVYTLVRALSSLGRSAVLTLIRGLRRGEIRFYRGEVTSAQVGLIHGQAAFHQLLLWTDARFDFSHEDIVRRQQIPLSPDELFADAERFLEGVREAADQLSPSMVLEQDVQRVAGLGRLVPTEVHGVLRMFDGHRVLADILEDSPYRVFETLRVAQRALEAGLLRSVDEQRPRPSWRTVLAIEEWLVGSETRETVAQRTETIDTKPVATVAAPSSGKKKKSRRKKQRRASTPLPIAQPKPGEIDWGALVPRVIGGEVGPLSGVVPAMDAHGEIDVASRDRAREGLEALMDTDKRQKIFPTEVGLEPSVVVRQDDVNPTDEWERVEWEAKAKVLAEDKAKLEPVAPVAPELPAPVAPAPVEPEPVAIAADPDSDITAERFRADAEQRVTGQIEKTRIERALREEAEAKERETAARSAAAEEARTYAARVKAAAEARRIEAEQAVAAMVATPTPAILGAPPAPAVVEAVPPTPTPPAPTVVEAAPPTPTPPTVVEAPAPAPAPPTQVDDEPSDGIVRMIEIVARAPHRRLPSEPLTDGPPVSETTGEISRGSQGPERALQLEPSILVAELEPAPVAAIDPLVADLAAAHSAIAAVVAKAAAAPQTTDMASASKELVVAEVRRDAVEFTDAEEAFFKSVEPTSAHPKVQLESFEDLDVGYQKPKFWDRVFGRKK